MLKRVQKSIWPTATFLLLALVVVLFLSIIKASLFTHVDEEKRIFFEISFLFLASLMASLLVSYTKQPLVMLLIIVGIVISPSFIAVAWPAMAETINTAQQYTVLFKAIPKTPPSIVSYDEVVKALAQLGAIILLFKIGMHSEAKAIFSPKNFFIAFAGVIVPFTAGYFAGVYLGYSVIVSLFIGATLTATSIGVSVAILEELKLIGRESSKLLLGAAVIDDVLGLLALSVVVSYSTTSLAVEPLLEIAVKSVVFIAGGVLFGKIIVENYFDKIREGKNGQAFLAALAFALFYAYVAEIIGLSGIIGAFLAGLALNYSKTKKDLLKQISPLESFLTPIFFISLGMLVDVNALSAFIYPILLITIIAILSKLAGCGLAAKIIGASNNTALLVGIGMIPRGEVAFIIGLYGLTMGVLKPPEYSIITAVAFLTTIIVPPLLKHVARGDSK